MAIGQRHRRVCPVGVAAAGSDDGDGAVPEIDNCIVDPDAEVVSGRDPSAVSLSCVRAVAQGIFWSRSVAVVFDDLGSAGTPPLGRTPEPST